MSNSFLKLVASGYRDSSPNPWTDLNDMHLLWSPSSDAPIRDADLKAFYWTRDSAGIGISSKYIEFSDDNAISGAHVRGDGMSIRCIKDQ